MEATAWVALGALGFTMMVTIIGGAIKMTWWLGAKFGDMKKTVVDMLDGHEIKDQMRHIENVTRFATIETTLGIIAKNGHDKQGKRRGTAA